MNKKFLTAFLFGAAVLASTSTFVSCKDYSDEIDALQTQIDNANALHATKAELAAAKEELTAAYKAADDQLNAAIASLKAASEAKDAELEAALKKEAERAAAAEAKLAAEIETLKEADAKLEQLIKDLDDKKLDKTTFEAFKKEAEETFAKLAAADEKLAADLADAVSKLNAKDEALQKEIDDLAKELRDADKVLQANIDKVDDAVKALEGEVAANKAVLLTLKSDFEQQKKACEEFQKAIDARVAAIEADYLTSKDKKELDDKIEATKKALQEEIDALDKRVVALEKDNEQNKKDIAQNKKDIEALATRVKALEDEVKKINEELVALNVLIKTSLRSLVFIPDSYYWGVEATEVNYLEYTEYALPAAAVKVADKFDGALIREHSGLDKDNKKMFKDGSKVLSFAAKYHINPQSAKMPTEASAYKLLTADKNYVKGTEADALLSIVGTPTADKGILTVQLNAKKPELIKSVPVNSAVTVFATEVTLPADQQTADKDVKVTSDYATVYRSNIKNLVMGYAKESDNGFYNEHCGPCTYYKTNSGETTFEGEHLFASEDELINYVGEKGFYNCDYDKTLDLSTLVETHFTDEKGTHMLMTADKLKACGLEYKFELVGCTYGSNNTDQSVHAAINPEDGVTFRPQEAELKVAEGVKVYNQKAYGAAQSRETIGRCPVVRVTLVDVNSGAIYDYGYLSIKITENVITPEDKDKVATIEYPGSDVNYYSTCKHDGFSEELYWNQIEHDVLKTLMDNYSMKEEEFQTEYANAGHLVTTAAGEVAQFGKNAKGEWEELKNYIGEVQDRYNAGDAQTSTLKWTIAGDYFVKNYYGKAAGSYDPLTVAVKYESLHPTIYPDIYIVLSTGKINVQVPSGVAFTDAQKIPEYWYKVDGNGASDNGFAEIHAQTIVPEETQATAVAEVLDDTFGDVFVGNKIGVASIDNLGKKNLDWESNTYGVTQTIGLYFSDLNNGKEYAALDGTKICYYTLEVSKDGLSLNAVKKNGTAITAQTVATITSLAVAGKAENQKIALNKDSEAAKAMLNYAAHNNLDKVSDAGKKVLKAIIMMKVTNSCGHELALTDKTFDVRFLRPINVSGNNKELEDAQDKKQTIELRDLINLSDWREYKFADHKNYWNYYNIKSIKVINANSDGNINAYITTTMNNANYGKTQSEVSNNVRFTVTYATPADKSKDSYGYIMYENLSSAVQTFSVNVPLLVEYEWGYIVTSVNVTVKNSHENAKLR